MKKGYKYNRIKMVDPNVLEGIQTALEPQVNFFFELLVRT